MSRAVRAGDAEITAGGRYPLGHQPQAVAGRVRSAEAVIAHLDGQEAWLAASDGGIFSFGY